MQIEEMKRPRSIKDMGVSDKEGMELPKVEGPRPLLFSRTQEQYTWGVSISVGSSDPHTLSTPLQQSSTLR